MTEENTEIQAEEAAREQGWVPKEEFRGDPERWRPAEEFLEVGKKIGQVQSERNDKLMREIKALKSDINEFRTLRSKEIAAIKEDSYNRAIKELKEKQLEAVEAGDVDEFKKIENEIQNTEKPVEQQPQKSNQPPQEFVEWAAKNPWYGNDIAMTAAADAIGQQLTSQYTNPKDWYKAIESQVKNEFPHKFEQEKKQSSVESPSGGGANGSSKPKHSYKDLPDEVRAVCDRYVKQGLMKREDYVKEYFA